MEVVISFAEGRVTAFAVTGEGRLICCVGLQRDRQVSEVSLFQPDVVVSHGLKQLQSGG